MGTSRKEHGRWSPRSQGLEVRGWGDGGFDFSTEEVKMPAAPQDVPCPLGLFLPREQK